MDHPRLPQFAGRDEELHKLDSLLKQAGPSGLRPVGICGMGGIGKTQLAVEYAHRYRYFYPEGVFLLNAAADWSAEFGRFAIRLQLRGGDLGTSDYRDQMAAAMATHLRAHSNALVIFDNVKHPAEMRHREIALGLLPVSLPCHVLFTTRKRFLGDGLVPFEIGLLAPEPARILLTHTRPELQSASDEVDETCRALGYLPLALELAAAFLARKPKTTLRAYRESLSIRGADGTHAQSSLKADDLDAYYAASLTPALDAQWSLLESRDSVTILQVTALFEPNTRVPIDRLALITALEDSPEGIVTPLADAIADARTANLLELLDKSTVRLHPLVNDYVRRRTVAVDQLIRNVSGNVLRTCEEAATLENLCARRGIDAVQEDIFSARLLLETWGGDDGAASRLVHLLRVVQSESHHLRAWVPQHQPVFFAQQIHNRALALKHKKLARSAFSRLSQLLLPHLVELWRATSESPETELVLWQRGSIVGVAVMPDNAHFVSLTAQGTLMLWKLRTGEPVGTFPTGYDWMWGLAAGADGNTALTVSSHRVLVITNLETGEPVRTIPIAGRGLSAVAAVPGGGSVVCGDEDGSVHFVNLRTGKTISAAGHEGRVWSIAVTTDDRYALSASDDQTIRLWDRATGRCIDTLRGHTGPVRGLAVIDDGTFISCSSDGTLKVWDIGARRPVRTIPQDGKNDHTKDVSSVAVKRGSSLAVSASSDRSVRLWNLNTGRLDKTLWGHSFSVNAVAMTTDGGHIVSGSNEGTLRVWNPKAATRESRLTGHGDIATSVALTPDGARGASASKEQTIKVWDVSESRELRTIPIEEVIVRQLAITNDGRFAVTVLFGGKTRQWDLATGADYVTQLNGADPKNAQWILSTDGRMALGSRETGEIALWDLRTGNVELSIRPHGGAPVRLALSKGARYAASACEGIVTVWDLNNGHIEGSVPGWRGGPDSALAVTPDGRFIASTDYDELRIWDVQANISTGIPRAGSAIRQIVSTWDSTRFITISDGGILQIWDARQAQEEATVVLDGELWDVAVASNDSTLLTGDRTGSVYCLQYIRQ